MIEMAPVLSRTGSRKLYPSDMAKRTLVGIQALRRRLRERVQAATEDGEHSVFTHYGKPVVALVPIEWYREAAKAMDDPTEL